MRPGTILLSSFQRFLQNLTVAVALLVLSASTIIEPAWAADSHSPAAPSASAPNDANPGSRNPVASKPVPQPNLADAVRPQHSPPASPAPSLADANQKLQRQGPLFIENRGQFDPRVKFLVTGSGANLWLTNEGIVFDFQRPASKQSANAAEERPASLKRFSPGREPIDPRSKSDPPPMERLVFKQKLVSPNPNPTIEAHDPQPGIYNYFIGNDPDKWRTHVLAYKEVVYRDIWKGIDLKLFANGPNLEEEFIVHPGADASAVRLAYEGIEGLSVADDGSLKVATAFGDIVETSPRIYQEIAGNTVPLSGTFKVGGQNSYSFEVAKHNERADLIIDPTVIYSKPRDGKKAAQGSLLYSTYLGGSAGNDFYRSNDEVATGVAFDAGGDAYVTGYTRSQDFPVTPGAFQTTYAGAVTAGFISKFNATGSALVYSSYIDNTIYSPVGIAVDAAGNAYVTGTSAQHGGFPTTANAYSQDCNVNAFLSMLDPTGSTLLYSTCFGQTQDHDGGQYVYSTGIAIDSNGHAFVVGYTSGSVPTTPNAFQTSLLTGYPAGFVTGFDTNASGASSLFYSTYFGPTSSDYYTRGVNGNAIAVDSFGKIYITGSTTDNLPVTPGAFQSSYISCNGICDHSFVTKLDPVAPIGQSLIYSTYLEGTYDDVGNGIAVDGLGNAFVTGTTTSSDFPTTPGAFQAVPIWNGFSGNAYASFVAKLNPGGSGLGYASYIEPVCTPPDCVVEPIHALGIAVDSLGNAYVTGWFRAFLINLPLTADAFQTSYSKLGSDFSESFLMKVNPAGSALIYSSYLGGEGDDVANAVAVDQTGDAYVAGRTSSTQFPVTVGAFQTSVHGTGDAFVTKFPIGVADGLSVTRIFPTAGGNAGQVTPEIIGTGFHSGATAQFNCGVIQVPGTNVTISSEGRVLRATFDLTATAPGICDVSVSNPDKNSVILPQAFTVQQGGAPLVSVSKITGGAKVGSNMTYYITVSNIGNIDATDLLGAETIDPWFTYLSSSLSTSSIIQSDRNWPTSPSGNQYDAQVQWEFPNLPFGSQLFTYTVNLDQQVPAHEQVQGGFCIANRNLAVIGCFDLDIACDLTLEIICAGLTDAALFACGSPVVAGCHAALEGCLKTVSLIPSCSSAASTTRIGNDPNQLAGNPGVGIPGWVASAPPLNYVLQFSNDGDAAVQRVVTTNPLNPAVVNTNTLRLATMIVVDHQVPIPPTFAPQAGLDQFDTNLDLRPAQDMFVQIHASLDPNTGLITWVFQSIDPKTGQPPTDPTVGFLTPGASVSLFFNVNPMSGLQTGTQITDQGTVVFDTNPPQNTNIWLNTLDNTPPSSHVTAFSGNQLCPNFTVQWSGSDIGSGIANYTIYVSDNGGAFTAWQTNTSSTSAVYNGQVDHSYGFYSIAQDLVGNIEPGKSSSEATTRVNKGTICGPVGPPTPLGGRH